MNMQLSREASQLFVLCATLKLVSLNLHLLLALLSFSVFINGEMERVISVINQQFFFIEDKPQNLL